MAIEFEAIPGGYLTRGKGILTEEDARHAVDQIERRMDELNGAVTGFNHWLEISAYEVGARRLFTDVVVRRRREFEAIHVCYGTGRLVRMGIAVANATLGGFLQLHDTADAFDFALSEHL
ncbi:MAG: hypothetical protein AAFQ82_26085, partial [Myxococcota bacterium]